MATTEPIRDKHQVKELADFYYKKGQYRNYLLVTLCVHTALRISDLLSICWADVYDFERGQIRTSITITEKKTGKSKIIALHKNIVAALKLCIKNANPKAFIIENRRTHKAISRVQAYRLIRAAAENLEFQNRVSCHSLRKTFGYHAWKNGVSPAVIMEIYNHASLATTRRYLGVSQDDKNEVYLKMSFASLNEQI